MNLLIRVKASHSGVKSQERCLFLKDRACCD